MVKQDLTGKTIQFILQGLMIGNKTTGRACLSCSNYSLIKPVKIGSLYLAVEVLQVAACINNWPGKCGSQQYQSVSRRAMNSSFFLREISTW